MDDEKGNSIFVALLRGINIGGRNKVDMKELQKTFERVGMKSVTTYINSGNVIFADKDNHKTEIPKILEKGILDDFDLNIRVLIRSFNDYKLVMKSLPQNWKNDADMKCDTFFLWDEINRSSIIKEIGARPGIDKVKYIPGAVLWRVDKSNLTKSGKMRVAATKLYQHITVRNVNTTRKIFAIMQELDD